MKENKKYVVVKDLDRNLFDILEIRFIKEIEKRVLIEQKKGRKVICCPSNNTSYEKLKKETSESNFKFTPTLI